MRKILLLLTILFIVDFQNSIALANQAKSEVKVSIDLNGESPYNVIKPIMKNGKLFVALKYFAQGVGATVYIDPMTQANIITSNEKQISLMARESTAKVAFRLGNAEANLEIAPIQIDNLLYVPLKPLTNLFGLKINWSSALLKYSVTELYAPPRGNTKGNLKNGGYLLEHNGWIYYSSLYGGEGRLYKKKIDGSNKTKISNDKWTSDINIMDDKIYCSSNGNLVKMGLNGENKVVLDTQARFVNVIGDWIYYCKGLQSAIYKIRIDGTGKKLLVKDLILQMDAGANEIYFESIAKLYKVADSGKSNIVLTSENIGRFTIDGDWVYYTMPGSDGLYKSRKDFKKKIKITSDRVGNINVSGDWIYYTNYSEHPAKFYKVKTDGSLRQKINNDKPSYIYVFDRTIYYLDSYSQTYKSINLKN